MVGVTEGARERWGGVRTKICKHPSSERSNGSPWMGGGGEGVRAMTKLQRKWVLKWGQVNTDESRKCCLLGNQGRGGVQELGRLGEMRQEL